MKIVLISTYELGHQPFGLTSAAAWLKRAGAEVTCQDAAVQHLDKAALAEADLIGYYVPMHTATRIAAQFIPTLKAHNPRAHVVCFGLYAPLNEPYLRKLGVDTILGGEFEAGLAACYRRIAAHGNDGRPQPEPIVSLDRLDFILPDRRTLPHLSKYAYFIRTDGQ